MFAQPAQGRWTLTTFVPFYLEFLQKLFFYPSDQQKIQQTFRQKHGARIGNDMGVVGFLFLARPASENVVLSVESVNVEWCAFVYFFSPAPRGPPGGVSAEIIGRQRGMCTNPSTLEKTRKFSSLVVSIGKKVYLCPLPQRAQPHPPSASP